MGLDQILYHINQKSLKKLSDFLWVTLARFEVLTWRSLGIFQNRDKIYPLEMKIRIAV